MASSNDSASEGLKKILGQVGQLMAMPDADPQALTVLMQIITKILQKGQAGGAQAAMAGGPPPGGGMGGPPSGPPPPGLGGGQPGGAPPGMMGLSMTGPNSGGPEGAPNADELRRLLTAGGATQ